MRRALIRLWDWFSQTTSPRWTMEWEDWASVVRAAIMAGSAAALAEISTTLAHEYATLSVNRLIAYTVVAMILQALRKWAGEWK